MRSHTGKIICLLTVALMVDCTCDDDPAAVDGSSVKFDLGGMEQGALDAPAPYEASITDAFIPPDSFTKDLSYTDLPPDQLVYLDGITTPAYEYVVDSMQLPSTPAQVQTYSLDLDGDGKVDNGLGELLATLALVMPALDLGAAVSLAVDSGELIHLFRLHATSLSAEPAAQLKSWLGKPETCCKTPSDPTKCASEADATCYSGSATFSPYPAQPVPNLLSGAIVSGKMTFGPAPLKLRLVVKGLGTLPLRLKGALITGVPSVTGIDNGIIGGAIDPKDLMNDVIPALAGMIDVIYKDPLTDSGVKGALALFLDLNSDGTITTQEVVTNPIATSYMAGDVDLDKDGFKELSVGVGFTAVPATIQ